MKPKTAAEIFLTQIRDKQKLRYTLVYNFFGQNKPSENRIKTSAPYFPRIFRPLRHVTSGHKLKHKRGTPKYIFRLAPLFFSRRCC